jgi:hypothetical protein
MIHQPELFSRPAPVRHYTPAAVPLDPPMQRHSETSRAAAEQAKPGAATQRQTVLEHIEAMGGLTDEQISDQLGISPNAARPRRVELVRLGLVADSGRKRATRSGRMASVWVHLHG